MIKNRNRNAASISDLLCLNLQAKTTPALTFDSSKDRIVRILWNIFCIFVFGAQPQSKRSICVFK